MTWTRRGRRLLGESLEPGKDKGSSKLTTASRLELCFIILMYSTRAELVKVKPIHAVNHGERHEYPAVRIKYLLLCFCSTSFLNTRYLPISYDCLNLNQIWYNISRFWAVPSIDSTRKIPRWRLNGFTVHSESRLSISQAEEVVRIRR